MNKMIATTADARYAPGVRLIAENTNLKARVHELEKQVDFYRRMWELAEDEKASLRDRLWETEAELPQMWDAGARTERRNRAPYLQRIYGIAPTEQYTVMNRPYNSRDRVYVQR